MSKQHRCLICKHQGNHHFENISSATLFRKEKSSQIHFCYAHSIEYFKIGQFSFFRKYQNVLLNAYSNTDQNVFDFLKDEIVGKNGPNSKAS